MARRKAMQVDTSEVTAFTHALEGLHVQMNTNQHLSAVTSAAFEVLGERFNQETHAAAANNVDEFHHVYEWDHVGVPGFQLWKNTLSGRGGRRSVSWTWRPSHSIVPTLTDIHGEERFVPVKGFDGSKLNAIHTFTWKAPMMEYGVNVRIAPKLSRVLVYPNQNSGGAGEPVFSPRPVHAKASEQGGSDVAGNFTTWFSGWWGGGRAQDLVEEGFYNERNTAFKRSFNKHIKKINRGTKMTTGKSFSITPDVMAARMGDNVARAIAGEMQHNYIAMANARRRRVVMEDGDE